MRKITSTLILGIVLGGASLVSAQADRFERFEPGLIVETGARMGACDVITFSRDGRHLLACGDDKVVRIWRVADAGLDPYPMNILRWSIFREQRGNVYAMALSPDPQYRTIAMAGLSIQVRPGAVILVDRVTGEIKKAMNDPLAGPFAVWALAFSPSGSRVAYGTGDGRVGVWNITVSGPNEIIRLRGHPPRTDKQRGNKVRLVRFIDENRLLSLAEDGQLLQWNVARPDDPPVLVHQFPMNHVWQARASGDGQTIGAVSLRDPVRAAVYSLAKKSGMAVAGPGPERAHSVALDQEGARLAVGWWVPGKGKGGESRAEATIYDLRQAVPRGVPGPQQSYHMDSLAFHPGGRHLAIGGGANHEVTYWNLERPQSPLTTIVSPGSCLWGVALSKDRRYLAFQEDFQSDPPHANQRGKGPWRIFDLENRGWAAGLQLKDIDPVRPLNEVDGWRVVPGADADTWYVAAPGAAIPAVPQENGKSIWKLPLNPSFDAYPRCYTFLRGSPPRLAVGHFWGVSIFELHPKEGPRRVRLMVGHGGEVMSVAPSADGKLLVTASRDQTIAAWSLAPWPTEPELGARFIERQGRVFVDVVDPGSPAWEAGLAKGDEVLVFALDADELFDPDQRESPKDRARVKKLIGSRECRERLEKPVPGRDHFFRLSRGGAKEPIAILTTVRQRPLWRFFPTRSGEWVMWRWRDYYYDCSTNGDSYIGWQVSSGKLDVTPSFYKAEQFRRRFYRPDKIDALIDGLQAPEKIAIPDLEPPVVALEVSNRQVKDQDLVVTLTVKARERKANQELDRVLLWINDHRYHLEPAAGFEFQKKIVVPRDRLRHGPNLLTLQCYNRAELRGESRPEAVDCVRPKTDPKLWGLLVGVGDYRFAKARVRNLNADADADVLNEVWQGQKSKQFTAVDIATLNNRKATPAAILKRLDDLAKQVKPDDLLVLFLGGHGASTDELENLGKRLTAKQPKAMKLPDLPPRSFFFVGPFFDPLQPYDTCITSQDLYERVARLPCRKLVLLDTCHAGTLPVNPVRELTRDGVGPVIIAACQPSEKAIEYGPLDGNRAYGLFTMGIRHALMEPDEFDRADFDRDQKIEARELADYLVRRVPQLVQRLKDLEIPGITAADTQQPAIFLPRMEERMPVAKK